MRSLLNALFCALALAGFVQAANAAEAPPPTQGPIYVTTFFEVTPGNTAPAVAMLKEYRDAARKEPGVMSSDILQEVGMTSRFASNEVWRDWAAYDAHVKASPRGQLFIKMLPIQYGPPDARPHLGHFLAPEMGSPTANSVVILSHLDVTPPAIPKLLEIMKPLSEGTVKDPGMTKYQILRQAPGTGNHFRLYEVWASERAWDAHNLAAHTQEFRNELATLLGTPYDQRKYTIVN
ncbi:MAG TPA: antibiotic biosynthesis monooxygenase [Micropepsaceae bacterium]|nr:antibiotic biosynthesis monooxygenase [Micropepsaceae bacterium]